jgi:hypothetical protein
MDLSWKQRKLDSLRCSRRMFSGLPYEYKDSIKPRAVADHFAVSAA